MKQKSVDDGTSLDGETHLWRHRLVSWPVERAVESRATGA